MPGTVGATCGFLVTDSQFRFHSYISTVLDSLLLESSLSSSIRLSIPHTFIGSGTRVTPLSRMQTSSSWGSGSREKEKITNNYKTV